MTEEIKQDVIKFALDLFQTMLSDDTFEKAQLVRNQVFAKYGNGTDNGKAEAVWQMAMELNKVAIN